MRIPFISARGLIAGCLLLLLTATALIGFIVAQKRAAQGWVSHTFAVADQLHETRVLMLRAEVQKRGFVLGGPDALRAEANALQLEAGKGLDRLAHMTADNAPQQRRVQRLRALYRERVSVTREILDLAGRGRPGDATAVALHQDNVARQLRWTQMIEEADRLERGLLKTRQAKFRSLEHVVDLAIAACAALLVILGLALAGDRRQRMAHLRQLNMRLEEDVERRKALEAELVAARASAEAAAASKSTFLANMSHEIRTPMNGVLGFTDLLLDSKLDADQHRQVQLISDSGKAMMRLLNDILDISKIEAGQIQIAPETVDLHHKLRNCTKLLQPAAAQKQVALECQIAATVPQFAVADGLRLRQIVLNLLGNAVKFTHQGRVTLSARVMQDGVEDILEVQVADTGIGIPGDRLSAIFDQFVQAEQSTASRFGGTGLGLAISKRLAGLMGGTLEVESEVGRGTTFTLLLPVAAAEQVVVEDAARVLQASPIGSANILLAEDHDVNQELMRSMLVHLGHSVTTVADGAQALAAATAVRGAERPFDLVLMDMQMPVMDGLAATRAIRAAGIGPKALPIVALTANAYADDIVACLSAGMQAHLAKPVGLAQLDAAIRSWAVKPAGVSAGPVAAAEPSATVAPSPPIPAALQARYEARKAELLAFADRLERAEALDPADVRELVDRLHKLAGSAGMFQQPELGSRAHDLEQALQSASLEQSQDLLAEVTGTLRRAG